MKTQRMFLKATVFPKGLIASGLLLALLLAAIASSAPVVHAATITVNSTDDSPVNHDGKCTLREAIRNANNDDGYWDDCAAGTGADTINITATGTILLIGDLDTIEKDVTVSGPGEGALILDGRYLHRGLSVSCSSPGCVVTISGLTVQKGFAGWGSAINVGNSSNVTLSHVIVQDNNLGANGVYGPVTCSGDGTSLTLNNVIIRNNQAIGPNGYAGGLYGDSGCLLFLTNVSFVDNASFDGAGGMYVLRDATLDQVSFTNNTTTGGDGGALYSTGTITVTNSSFTNNYATGASGRGGAIMFGNGGPKGSIDTSTFTGNTADSGAAIVIGNTDASLTVTNTTFADNIAVGRGGGILNSGNLNLTNVTFSGNQVTDPVEGSGGAVHNDAGQVTLTNATFDLNSALAGSAIYNGTGGTTTLVNNTITRNANGPAIRGYSGITLKNTIVSDHAAGNCELYSGEVTDGGGNLNFASHGHDCPGISADPQLYFLGPNGGYVMTRRFMTGSGAINAGNATTCAAAVGSPTFGAGSLDARGFPRRSGFCDIGAFEAQPASLSMLAGSSPQIAVVNATFTHSLGVNVTDAYTNTLGGVTVTFAAPASGASALLSATTTNSVSSGIASVTATANGLAGSYNVTAAVSGQSPINFVLTNKVLSVFLPLLKR